MTTRPAEPADLAAITALEESGFEAKERWSERAWAEELAADNRIVLVVGDPVHAVATVQHVGEVAELNRIVVAPAARGRGVASALLSAGIAAATELDCTELLLEVRHDNEPALRLYRGHRFTEIARRAGYYGQGVDAVIMRRELDTAELEEAS
ncbi:ribosomal-protein-alanine N-acetyltransferase [Propionibacteriaceae bacterium ES.041]|uniref:GNAT family N-acetyltransferase n=1 Tax=Enemella evansiae TaxID=2016499 RepID=UPI000B9646D5|nr:GNAT family N-acetyltransferase [Enemella evansiae]OYO10245.1 ribosomal-protein-alanine N-acetyltransferase [Enemella evansiae]PFG68426.1 ribosomal-protein-alanine N-acetyltransferase [Propionibacteriaceae bacterium ES.041]